MKQACRKKSFKNRSYFYETIYNYHLHFIYFIFLLVFQTLEENQYFMEEYM